MSDHNKVTKEQRLRVEPPSPVAVQGWAAVTDHHVRLETATEALIRDLQARVHRLEQLVRAYGMSLQDQPQQRNEGTKEP